MPARQLPLLLCAFSASLLILSGCTGLSGPPVNPEDVVAAALESYDKNGDGALDKEELKASPGLMEALIEVDLNGNRMIDSQELLNRLKPMYGQNVAYTGADCIVTLDGSPLEGATVKFIPDQILGEGTTKAGEGVTGSNGFAEISISAEQLQSLPENLRNRKMMQVGIYSVEITHPTITIPAKYNTETELGFELHPDLHYGPHAKYDLTTK